MTLRHCINLMWVLHGLSFAVLLVLAFTNGITIGWCVAALLIYGMGFVIEFVDRRRGGPRS